MIGTSGRASPAAGEPPAAASLPRSRDLPTVALRVTLAALAIALAACSWLAFTGQRDAREAVLRRLSALEVPAPVLEELAADLAGEAEPARVRLDVARALVADALAGRGPHQTTAAVLPRLALARELAAEAFAGRPAAWEAPLLLGASTYLERSLRGDRRLVTEAAAWNRPLEQARELAPAAPEPARFQVTAYVELWNYLSPARREEARRLVGRAFRDGPTFSRLIGPWLDRAGDPDEAMAALPDLPFVWQRLQQIFADRGDWPSVLAARERWRAALADDLERRLAEAARRRHGGDAYGARQIYLRVIAAAPPEKRFVPLVERALSDAPPGSAVPSLREPLAAWLGWVLDLELTGHRPLPPAQVDRLAGLIPHLAAPLAARAALAADRLDLAEHLERGAAADVGTAAWSPYWIDKARLLLARRHAEEARGALARVAPTWWSSPSYLLAARRAAQEAGDTAGAAAADRELVAAAGRVDALRPLGAGGGTLRFEIYLEDAATQLLAAVDDAGDGALLEVGLDGAVIEAERARSGRRLRVPVAAAAGLHLVSIEVVVGRRLTLSRLSAVEG